MGSIGPANNVLSTLQQLKIDVKTTELSREERRLAYDEARAVMLALEDDGDALVRLQWGVFETIALDIASRMGLLDAVVKSDMPETARGLSKRCDVELLLTTRILRTLDAYGCVDSSISLDRQHACYSDNRITRLATTERGIVHMQWWTRTLNPIMFALPQKLQDNDFRSLTSSTDTVLNDIRGRPGLDFFQLLTPDEVASTHRLINDAKTDEDAVFFVDVGGSAGQQAYALRKQYPEAPGKFIVQDRGDVLKGILPGLEAMDHDFLTPQPIRGARTYYLRNIMHDWNSDIDVKILKHIRDAMEPGYSRVLMQEWIIPLRGAGKLPTSLDLCLMSVLGGEERSLEQHREYIEAAGLRISNVYDINDGRSQSVIECELA